MPMEDFFSSLTSPVWWVSVVVVGILISVIGAYLKEWIDTMFSNLFSFWKSSVRVRRIKHQELVEKMQQCDRTLILLGFEESRFRLRSMVLSLVGMLCVVLVFQGQADASYAKYLPYLNVYGGLIMVGSFLQLRKAIKIKSIMYRNKFNPREYI